MSLPTIEYLGWAMQYHGRAELELGTSGLHPAPRSILGDVDGVDDPATILRFAEALSGFFEVPVGEVVPALGTTQALWLAMASASDEGDVVAVEDPGYEPLVRVAEGMGRRVVRHRRRFENGWAVELEEIDRVLAAGARLVVVTDLHNPTGVALPEDVLAQVAARATAAGARVLVDEVYRLFDPTRTPLTTRRLSPAIVAIGSFTKAFGLGWARAGWLLGPPDVTLRARRALWHVVGINPPSHAAFGLAALARLPELRRRTDEIVGDKRDRMARWIASRDDVDWVLPARGLFGMVRLRGVPDDLAFVHELLEKHSLLLGPGSFFGAPGCVRLSWGAELDRFERGLDVLGRALDARRRS